MEANVGDQLVKEGGELASMVQPRAGLGRGWGYGGPGR